MAAADDGDEIAQVDLNTQPTPKTKEEWFFFIIYAPLIRYLICRGNFLLAEFLL